MQKGRVGFVRRGFKEAEVLPASSFQAWTHSLAVLTLLVLCILPAYHVVASSDFFDRTVSAMRARLDPSRSEKRSRTQFVRGVTPRCTRRRFYRSATQIPVVRHKQGPVMYNDLGLSTVHVTVVTEPTHAGAPARNTNKSKLSSPRNSSYS